MSNRTQDQISEIAEWRMGYEAQIEALTAPGLTTKESATRFMDAAEFTAAEKKNVLSLIKRCSIVDQLIAVLWGYGHFERSLFAHLPNCSCPVIEREKRGRFEADGIPRSFLEIEPTRASLEPFMRVQLRERFGV